MEQNNFGHPENMSQMSNIQELDLSSNSLDDIPLDEDIVNKLFCQYIRNQSDDEELVINSEDDPIRNPYKILKYYSYNEMLESLNDISMEELHSIQRYF